jgi:tRNA(Ile)-lysidine synthase TilS/MesJ
MPRTVPGITFDEQGICSYCLSYRIEKPLGEGQLKKIIDSTRQKDNTYDCIVPLSGGRDSTYVLYLAKATYDLKVLAVSCDNEFRTEQAATNMRNACKELNVKLVSVRSKRDINHKIVKYGILSANSFGQFRVCAGCAYGYRSVVYRAAEKYKVPLILWGASRSERTTDLRVAAFSGSRQSKIQALSDVNFCRFKYSCWLQRLEFRVRGNSFLSRSLPRSKDRNVKEVYVFHYIPWDRKKIKGTVREKLGWQKPPDHVSTWRIDCKLHQFVNYYFFKLFGCSKDCLGYCNMINSGQMTREEALRQEEEMAARYEEGIRELLEDEIGLPKKEVASILSFGK